MTVAAPRTMSPPAKTPGMLVMPLLVGDDVAPLVELEVRRGRGQQRVARVPMATTTMSQSIVNSEPGMGTGRRRPPRRLAELHPLAAEAGDPAVVVAEHLERRGQQLEADALLLGVVDLLGAGGQLLAAAPVDDRRLGSAPSRLAVRTASIATLPPPTTTTRWPWSTGRVGLRAPGAHEVDPGEVLVGRVDALEVLARARP
jgi:hypothetical protein